MTDSDQLTLFAPEPPANRSALQDCEAEWLTNAVTSRSSLLKFLMACGPSGWFGRTSPVSFPHGLAQSRRVIWSLDSDGNPQKQVISDRSSTDYKNSGMGLRGEFLTLSTLEFHSAGAACSLSDILEVTGDVQQRYYLSATACRGILRRAEKRGKTLPVPLIRALEGVADQE